MKGEISRLQTQPYGSRNNYRGTATVVPVVIPSAKTKQATATAPIITDTIYVRDTIRVMDTVRVMDTLTLVKRDTITRMNKPTPVAMVIENDTLVNQKAFDYTAIPAEVILFDIGRSNIRQVYYSRLNYIAGILIKHPGLQASITGHTDKSGSQKINNALSLKRAQNVEIYLTNKGVPAARLTTNALSWLEPAVSGNSKSASSQNRRVEIRMLNK